MYNIDIKFEYYPLKSVFNLRKHGLSFEEAKNLWFVQNVFLELKHEKEKRLMLIGLLNDKCYSCVFTLRESRVRIISVRRSRKNEEELYHEKRQEKKDDFSQGI